MAKVPFLCRFFGHSYETRNGSAVLSSYQECTRCGHKKNEDDYDVCMFEVNWWWDHSAETGRDLRHLQNDHGFRLRAWEAVNAYRREKGYKTH